ncbi:hypothetical protein [Streptomyces sp. CBMA29]|uniref:hypothetical protein n=1 Tax=Streptomyces sp. CBMA29 TaxID=1896314 RepID=UPI001661FACF|nr:hypothetical protein [Streptomyces sp. CBMA29]MBD0739058.1 hypothetical protein [Streptomyces sp. CBMA29]
MTPGRPSTAPPATHGLWTIARIQNTLSNEVLIRRFLLDLTHAPEHEVMNVFTAWQKVAAAIEHHSLEAPALPASSRPAAEGR